MKRTLRVITLVLLLFCFAFSKKKQSPSAVAVAWYADSVYNGDTLVIPCRHQPFNELNDTVQKHLNGRGNNVKLLMVSQGCYLIDSIDLTLLPNIEILEFPGDVDIMQNRRYDFMNLKKLRVLRCWSVYRQSTDMVDWGTHKDVKKIVHRFRPDVRVVFPRRSPPVYMGEYE